MLLGAWGYPGGVVRFRRGSEISRSCGDVTLAFSIPVTILYGMVKKAGTRGDRRSRGRPRDDRVDDRILAAALGLLEDRGFQGMSVSEVARRARVSKPTIYLRWPGKAELAIAAVARVQVPPPLAGTGRPRVDLERAVDAFRVALALPSGASLLGTALTEAERMPELIALFRQRILEPRRRSLRSILERARRDGELDATADLDGAVNMLVGSLYARHLAGEPIGADWPGRVVELTWAALQARATVPPGAQSR